MLANNRKIGLLYNGHCLLRKGSSISRYVASFIKA